MFLERVYKSNNIFEPSFHLGENFTISKKREVLKSKDKPENKNLISWKNFNKQIMVKFLGCYNTTPLKKNLVLEIC